MSPYLLEHFLFHSLLHLAYDLMTDIPSCVNELPFHSFMYLEYLKRFLYLDLSSYSHIYIHLALQKKRDIFHTDVQALFKFVITSGIWTGP
jgi:hypothetical protein